MGGIKKYYYFQVHARREEPETGETKLISHYFRSAEEAAKHIGCSRPTIFNMIRNPDKSVYSKMYIVERCEPPVPMFEKVKINDVIIT